MKRFTYTVLLAFLSVIILNSCGEENPEVKPPDSGKESLLTNPQTGSLLDLKTIDKFTFATNSEEVVLFAASNAEGKIYAIRLDDNKASDAGNNLITKDIAGFGDRIAATLGLQFHQMAIEDMKLNPLSKALYMLVGSKQNAERKLVRVSNSGEKIDPVDLSNVTYAEIEFSTAGDRIQDIVWGDERLFLSYQKPASLKGYVAEVASPIENGFVVQSRATTVFKTNWGGDYFTNAPLETLAYLDINGDKRLAGITVCAPGFSFPVQSINNGTDLLQIKEYFNLNNGFPKKAFGVEHMGKTYLIELHDNGRVTRVGEKYLDGSQTLVNKDAQYLLRNGGRERSVGFTDEDVLILIPHGSFTNAVAKVSDETIYVISRSGDLDHNFELF